MIHSAQENESSLHGQNIQHVPLAPVGGVMLENVNKEGVGDDSHHVVSQEEEAGQLLVQHVAHFLVLLQACDDDLLLAEDGREV